MVTVIALTGTANAPAQSTHPAMPAAVLIPNNPHMLRGGCRQERKTGIADRSGELHGARAQPLDVTQGLAKFDRDIRTDPFEMDHTVAAIVDLDAGARLAGDDGRWRRNRRGHAEARVD